MNDQIVVMKHIIQLTDTMEEGLEHVKYLLDQRSPEKAVQLLLNTTDAFTHIERAIQHILPEVPENSIQENTDKLRGALDSMVSEYEATQGSNGREIIQFVLEPAFKNWRSELQEVLTPFTLS